MSVQVKITHAKQIEELFGATPKQAKIVLWRAITRAATAAKTRASKNVIKDYIVSADDVRNSMKIVKKSATAMAANLRSEGNAVPLINFDTTPQEPSVAPVYSRVLRRGGKRYISNAFVKGVRKTGSVHVMTRVGTNRRPIKVKYGPSIPQMIGRKDIMDDILERAEEVLDKRLEHELNRLLRGEF